MKRFDSINVIPFIDIMLVLLAIVLVTASFISQGKIEVNVPESESKAKIQSKDIVELITISKDGGFFYQDDPISLAALDQVLARMKSETRIAIRIDADTAFQKFVLVTDLLKKNNLKKVSVLTHQDALPSNVGSATLLFEPKAHKP